MRFLDLGYRVCLPQGQSLDLIVCVCVCVYVCVYVCVCVCMCVSVCLVCPLRMCCATCADDSGDWQSKQFKEYNWKAMGPGLPSLGALHPLLKVRAQLRGILLEMGFEEMPTNKWIESSFWNFDTLFQPQQHPARESHDTFFLSSTSWGAPHLNRFLLPHPSNVIWLSISG